MTEQDNTAENTTDDSQMEDSIETEPDAAADSPRAPIADGEGASVDDAHAGASGLFADTEWPELRRKLQIAAIVGLALLAAWATFQIYVSTSRAIAIWLSRDFVPLFQAAFNAIVVAVAIAGILWIRRTLA